MLILSVLPTTGVPSVPLLDKAAHVGQYLVLAWLLVRAIRLSRSPEETYRVWAWIYASSYGLLMELIQAMVPWRSADWIDAACNALGAAVGVWLGDRVPRD